MYERRKPKQSNSTNERESGEGRHVFMKKEIKPKGKEESFYHMLKHVCEHDGQCIVGYGGAIITIIAQQIGLGDRN